MKKEKDVVKNVIMKILLLVIQQIYFQIIDLYFYLLEIQMAIQRKENFIVLIGFKMHLIYYQLEKILLTDKGL